MMEKLSNLKFLAYLFLFLMLPLCSMAQVDSVHMDSTHIESICTRLAINTTLLSFRPESAERRMEWRNLAGRRTRLILLNIGTTFKKGEISRLRSGKTPTFARNDNTLNTDSIRIDSVQVDSTHIGSAAADTIRIPVLPDSLQPIFDMLNHLQPDTLARPQPDTIYVPVLPDSLQPVLDIINHLLPDTSGHQRLHPPPGAAGPSQPDTLLSNVRKVTFKVHQWQYHAPLQAALAATDSTLRWQVWLDWMTKKNRDPGVITYRLGSSARRNTMQVNAQEPQYLQLYWEDIPLNDPVSGMADWSYIPRHKIEKIYKSDLGTVHRTTFHLKEHYLNKPMTKLKYTESSNKTRGLEFMLSYNFSQKTNAELSYWSRQDGGEYDNSAIKGPQIYAKVTHIIDHRQEVKINFLSNHYDVGLPFGYNIPDPFRFAFNHYVTNANEPSGKGDRASTIIGLHYYRRSDTTKPTDLHAGIFMNGLSREVKYSADTTSYNVHVFGANIRKWYRTGPLKAEGAASFEYFANDRSAISSLAVGNWGQLKAEGRVNFQALPFLQLNGQANYRKRSDGYADSRLGVSAKLQIGNLTALSAGITTGSRMPTPQQLYWQANEYHGNPNLQREQIEEMHGKLQVMPYDGLTVGLEGYLKQIKHGIMIGADSTFTNETPYGVLSTDAFFTYNLTHFEFSGSATLQQFGNFMQTSPAPLPVNQTSRIWFKGGAYIKGYLFHHATYMKVGLAGMMSPQAYIPEQYYPSLGFWQASGSRAIPPFNRLDLDISARVRWIMFVLRFENVLDGVNQLGYFETAGYPMPGRRFIFGLRVYFRD
jgi:hypothetical protein